MMHYAVFRCILLAFSRRRYTSLQEISKSSKEKMQKDGIDIKGAASASALGQGSLESEKQIKVDRQSVEKFEKAVERTRVSTVGSKPPRDGRPFLFP